MYINIYALEAMATSRLASLRAESARRVLLRSLDTPRPGPWAALKFALRRLGRAAGGRKITRPRHA